jgi:hypothetical protein
LTARDYPALRRGGLIERGNRSFIPSDANGKSTLRPVSSFNNRHFSSHVAPWSIEDLVGVSVIGSGEIVTVAMAGMEMDAIVGVHARHDG